MGKIFCQLYNNQYFVLYYLTKLIFMKLKMFFTSLLAILFIGVSYSQDSTSTNKAWKQGDFFVGVNSNLLEVSANSIGKEPFIIVYLLVYQGRYMGRDRNGISRLVLRSEWSSPYGLGLSFNPRSDS